MGNAWYYKNDYGFPGKILDEISNSQGQKCAYCRELMSDHLAEKSRREWATIEHLNYLRPFNWNEVGFDRDKIKENVVFCCWSCNSSRGKLPLFEWFARSYCSSERNKVNLTSVAEPVRKYIERRIAEGAEW